MPSFAGQRIMSDETIATLTSLIAELPHENRDLLYTVVELMNATAANSKETRMTIGNLLLVFCPSLSINPALLRVLCEVPGVWDGQPSSASESVSSAPSISTGDTPSTLDISDAASYDSDSSDVSAAQLGVSRDNFGDSPYPSQFRGSNSSPYRSSNNSSSGQDDAASYVSALDRPPSPSDDSSSNLPALTASTD